MTTVKLKINDLHAIIDYSQDVLVCERESFNPNYEIIVFFSPHVGFFQLCNSMVDTGCLCVGTLLKCPNGSMCAFLR